MRTRHVVTAAATLMILAAAGGAALALADEHGERGEREHEHEHEGRHRREGGLRASRRAAAPDPEGAAGLALYRKECGACHLAYPPDLLPAASWRRTLSGLERHFGQNAELEAGTLAALDRWLAGQAGGRRTRAGEETLRITETSWFRRKHHELDPQVASRPAVRSLANCQACHPGAAEWDFEEDRVKIPR